VAEETGIEEKLAERFEALAQVFRTIPADIREEIITNLHGLRAELEAAFAVIAPVANWGVCFRQFVRRLEELSGATPGPQGGGEPYGGAAGPVRGVARPPRGEMARPKGPPDKPRGTKRRKR